MGRKLKAVVIKELLDLIRDRTTIFSIIVIPLIMFPLMGLAFSGVQKAAPQEIKIAVMNLDSGKLGEDFINFMKSKNNTEVTVVNKTNGEPKEVIRRLYQEKGINEMIIIPESFTRDILNPNRSAEIKVYSYTSIGSFTLTSIESVIEGYKSISVYRRMKIINKTIDPLKVLTPLAVSYVTIVGGRELPSPPTIVKGLLATQSWAIPISVLIVIMTSMQIVATSVASEKEAKTLETLLSTPISRFSILIGKVISSSVLAVLGAASYSVGLLIYMRTIVGGSLEQKIPADEELIRQVQSIILNPTVIIGVLVLMFLALIAAIALAVSLSVYAEDVRSAQALVSYLSIPLFIPAMATMAIDPEILPLPYKLALYAIPFTHAMTSVNRLIEGNYFQVFLGAIYMLVFAVIFLYIAAKFFGTEKILTAKISFRRKKERLE